MDARPPAPDGNHPKTALFLDLVGSTAAQEAGPGRAGDSVTRGHDYAAAKARFLRRARAYIAGYGGFPQAGPADDFCAGFDNPQDAVVCALVLQASFAARPVVHAGRRMACRIGLHAEPVPGTVQGYLGAAGNLASRLPSNVPPGGVAVSAPVRELCQPAPALAFTALGAKELKGISGSREVFAAQCDPAALEAFARDIRGRLREQHRAWLGRLGAAVTVLRPWLECVARDCELADTVGVDLGPHETGDRGLQLADVFINLRVHDVARSGAPTGRGRPDGDEEAGETRSANVLDALFEPGQRHQVFVGEPGSGKSTFLQYVTLYLAEKHSGRRPDDSRFRGRPVPAVLASQRLVPLRIVLRDFTQRDLPGVDRRGTSRHVLAYLEGKLKDGGHDLAAAALPQLLADGQALVCFDGLDEVPPLRLSEVQDAITDFQRQAFGKCRVVVTCRVASYARPDFRLPGFPPERTILPLDPRQRGEFIDAWYADLANARKDHAGRAAECAESLKAAIAEPQLAELAANPFFLSCMVGQHRPERRLPRQSALLMEEIVKGVLTEARKAERRPTQGPRPPSTLEQLLAEADVRGGVDSLREKLEKVAYDAREIRAAARDQSADTALDEAQAPDRGAGSAARLRDLGG